MAKKSAPQVLAWHICDALHIDPSSGKLYILGTFSSIQTRQFPSEHPYMVWLLVLGGLAAGKHKLAIDWVIPGEEPRTVLSGEIEAPANGGPLTIPNQINRLPLTKAGMHQIRVTVDGEELLLTGLDVRNA